MEQARRLTRVRTRLTTALTTRFTPGQAALLAAAAPAVVGLSAGLLEPRGAMTTLAALVTILAAFVAGFAAGVVGRSRWVWALAPLALAASFEVARLPAEGPTIDGIHLDSTYGIVAFVVGRGVDFLLMIVPLLVGVGHGRWFVALDAPSWRRDRIGAVRRWTARGVLIASSITLVGFAVLLARPASTPPVTDAVGDPIPGSLAELTRVRLGGVDQGILLRGASEDLPVLLYLHGGPGGTDMGVMRVFGGALEREFVVVSWDQRGSIKSVGGLDDPATMTPEQVLADTIELTEYLRGRFGEERIYLLGNSWGSTLAVLAAQQRPELFHAVIGTGQMVSQAETDRLFWEDTIAWARGEGRTGIVEELTAQGPPPYGELLAYDPVFAYEREWNSYDRTDEYDAKGELPFAAFTREYTLIEQIRALGAFLETFAMLYPRIQDIDFRREVPALDVPFYMAAGVHEARGRAVLADEWFEMLQAPIKVRADFPLSGHRPHVEEPGRFAELMQRVLAETYPSR